MRFAQNARKAESRTMMQPPPFGTYERMCVSVCRNAYARQTGCLPVWRRINGAGDIAASFSQQFLYHRVDILFFVLIYSADDVSLLVDEIFRRKEVYGIPVRDVVGVVYALNAF